MKSQIKGSIFFLFLLLFCQMKKIYLPCLFHKFTNLYCPGCGITRMFLSLLKLDFYQAFRYNPLVFLLLVFFIPVKILIKNIPKKYKNYASYFLVFVVVLYGVLRNTSMFSYLKPTIIH